MSQLGLGRVKTPTFNLRVEIPSRFRKFENQKCLRPLLREDDRENNSAHSWLVHVFTQPGSLADMTGWLRKLQQGRMSVVGPDSDICVFLNDVRSTPTNGSRAARTARPFRAKRRRHILILIVASAKCFPVAHVLPPDTCDNSSSLSSVLTKLGAPLSGSLFGFVGLNSRI
jgi:hypothetical protein